MEINRENLETMRTTINLRFRQGLELAPALYQQLAMIEGDAAHSSIEFPFMEAYPVMREWVGDRQIKNLESKKIRVEELPYEATFAIPVRDVETDNWGIYGNAAAALGEAGEQLWDELLVKAMLSPKPWIDGKAFYASDRKFGKSVINNVTASALSHAAFGTFFLQMSNYCDKNGSPLASRPTHLIVGPGLEDTAREILCAETYFDSDGKEHLNAHRGKVELIVLPRLIGTSANYWFLGRFDGVYKPLLVLKNKPATLTILNSPTDENVFMGGKILYGSEAYGSAAALFPHLLGRGGALVS